MFCMYCGKEIVGKPVYCPFCGNKQNQNEESVQQIDGGKDIEQTCAGTKSDDLQKTMIARGSDTNVYDNRIYVSKGPNIQYFIAFVVMCIILLRHRLDFVFSIPLLLVVILLVGIVIKFFGALLPPLPAKKNTIKEMSEKKITIQMPLGIADIDVLKRQLGARYSVNYEQEGKRLSINKKGCEYVVCYNADNSFSVSIIEKKRGLSIDSVVRDYVRIVNQIQTLGNKGGGASEVKPIIIAKKRKVFRDYIWILAEVAICIVTITLMWTKDNEYKIIESIQRAVPAIENNQISYAKALGGYCDETRWDYYKDKGIHVTFQGRCKLPEENKRGILVVDWEIDDRGYVSIDSIRFDGEELTEYESMVLLAEAFGYSLY